MIATAHGLGFGSGNHPQLGGNGGDIADIGPRVVLETPLLLGGADFRLDRLGFQRRLQRQLDGADRFVFGHRHEALGRQAVAGCRRRDQQLGHLVTDLVGRHDIRMAPREDRAMQESGNEAHREVGDDAVECLLGLVHRIPDRPVGERCIRLAPAFGFVALEGAGDQVHLGEDVAKAGRELFTTLDAAAKHQQGNVGHEGKGGREARQLLVVTAHFRGGIDIDRREVRTGHAQPQGAEAVLDGEADVAEQRLVKIDQAFAGIRVLRRLHFRQQEGMAADGALPEDDQRAGEDVGTLDGDADRHLLVSAAHEVRRAKTDPLAADDVHAVVDHLTRALGDVVLGDGGDHRGLFAKIDGPGGHRPHGIHHVGVGTDAGQCFLNALELADGHLELRTDAGITADGTRRHLRHAGIRRGQRDRTAGSQTLHQHAPALTGHLRPADDEIERHEHIGATHRPVHEHGVEREMAAAGIDAGVVIGHQCTGDTDMLLVAEQAIRIVEMEGQAENGAHRRQRDVSLVEGNAHAQHFLALIHALADDAGIRNRRRIGASPRAGQCKGRNLDALGQTRQVMVFLRVGSVVQQQLGRTERIGDHHRDRQRA